MASINSPKRKICVVTGSRADYGLLRWTLLALQTDKRFDLQLCVTGMHLAKEFGSTEREILDDGLLIKRKIDSRLISDSPFGISRSMAAGVEGFAKVYLDLKPDLLLVVGDRFETFAAVVATLPFGIPVAHCHGGELTLGAIDEAMRHAITKMSHLHFVSTEAYKRRVIQLGEDPDRVFISGALGLENISKIKLLGRRALEEELKLPFREKLTVVTFHPPTLELDQIQNQFKQILGALLKLKDTTIVFTMPNADTGGRVIMRMIERFVKENPESAKAFASLGTERYLSLLKQADFVLGNSSSGIIEAPSLKIPTINVGDRQKGRIRAKSVIDVPADTSAIIKGIRKSQRAGFQNMLRRLKNPYDVGSASVVIVRELKRASLKGINKKVFHDL